MTFPHEHPDFHDAIDAVASRLGIGRALVEKDYFVTHALWALHDARLEVWFKGGTSLSKGFGIIERFSEDLDLKIEPGTALGVPPSPPWKGEKPGHERARKAWFEALASVVPISGCTMSLNLELVDPRWRSAVIDVAYPGCHLSMLGPGILPVIRLEIGSARVVPFVERPIGSWVHSLLDEAGILAQEITDNRPAAVRCIHPFVTLVEKIDAISRRYARAGASVASFVRHYDDAGRIVDALNGLPPIGMSSSALVEEMVAQRQIRRWPSPEDPAFMLAGGPRDEDVRRAWLSIAPMYWGLRIPLEMSCNKIRTWIAGLE